MVPDGMAVKVFCAGYDDLPHLSPAKPGNAMANLEDMSTFDAAIVGWGSFSHLTSRESRVRALKAFAKSTKGPIVVSFLSFRPSANTTRLETAAVPSREFQSRSWQCLFRIHRFLSRDAHEARIVDIAHQSGLKIVHLNTDGRDTNWPHAVLLAGDDSVVLGSSNVEETW